MVKVEPRKVIKAEFTLMIDRLALAVQYEEEGKGSNKRRTLKPTDWLDADGKTILFDPGKRLKGWLKESAMTLGGETKRDVVAFGVTCRTIPKPGHTPVGTLAGVTPSRTWGTFVHRGDYVLNGLPEPEVEAMITAEGRSVYAMYYVLSTPVEVKVRVDSFARGITFDMLKDWMENIGQLKGLGDKHNASSGYGQFTVKESKLLGEHQLQY